MTAAFKWGIMIFFLLLRITADDPEKWMTMSACVKRVHVSNDTEIFLNARHAGSRTKSMAVEEINLKGFLGRLNLVYED